MSLLSVLKKRSLKTISNRSGEKSLTWIINRVKEASKDKKFTTSKFQIGQMSAFIYDAKHKSTLPYYDRFPLIFPINFYNDGILGLNMHYLTPKQRKFLMMHLMTFIEDDNITDNTRLNLSYKALNGVAKYKLFRPTIHRYLYSHLQSKILTVPPDQWINMLDLPLANFSGATKLQVYKESKSKII